MRSLMTFDIPSAPPTRMGAAYIDDQEQYGFKLLTLLSLKY